MKVQELLANIHNQEFNIDRDLQVKKYLPIDVKKTIAQGIMYECIDDTDGAIKVDSVQKYMSYVKYMITMHTNLEYMDENYDVLCSTQYGETSLLNAIMSCFEADASECSRILDLMMADKMQETSIEFVIAKFLNELKGSLGGIVNNINGKIEDFDLKSMMPDDMDMNKLSTFLNEYV